MPLATVEAQATELPGSRRKLDQREYCIRQGAGLDKTIDARDLFVTGLNGSQDLGNEIGCTRIAPRRPRLQGVEAILGS